VVLAVGAMAIVILAYDQLVFRPIVAWADKFRFEQTAASDRPKSWVYDLVRRTRLMRTIFAVVSAVTAYLALVRVRMSAAARRPAPPAGGAAGDALWLAVVLAAAGYALWLVLDYIRASLGIGDALTAGWYGLLTLTRVIVLIAIASAIWVPIGVWIGLRPWAAERVQPVAQFLAAFPANLLFPIVVSAIVVFKLSPNIWLSPLMILGTQWYILFNVIAGASAIPAELRAVGASFRVRGWLWWRRIALPAVLPYYVTGAITASGGSWNASIVAEVASWGNHHLEAKGLGAYIAQQTDAGDFHRIVLGIAVMSLYVVVINRVFWRPLYLYAERKFRLG
jgi:NitT/TauT family transport system permease protein